jgi:hypothetical protein
MCGFILRSQNIRREIRQDNSTTLCIFMNFIFGFFHVILPGAVVKSKRVNKMQHKKKSEYHREKMF